MHATLTYTALPGGRFFRKECVRGYRFGFNGKEKTDEWNGEGNIYDYGFRIYNPRICKFLSVDPLSQSYPWYTPYQFAGNKPIIAIDLDGLEEKIVIYYNLANGKVMTTVIDGNAMTKSISVSGSGYTITESISREEWISNKESLWAAFSNTPNLFASGYKPYTAMGGSKTNGGYPPPRGTLMIGAGTQGLTLVFNSKPTENKEIPSSFDMVMDGLKNPSPETEEALNTMKNYVAGISLITAGPSLFAGEAGFIGYLSALSSVDQLSGGEMLKTGNQEADKYIGYAKLIINLVSLKNGVKSIKDFKVLAYPESSRTFPDLITNSAGTILDVQDAASNTTTNKKK